MMESESGYRLALRVLNGLNDGKPLAVPHGGCDLRSSMEVLCRRTLERDVDVDPPESFAGGWEITLTPFSDPSYRVRFEDMTDDARDALIALFEGRDDDGFSVWTLASGGNELRCSHFVHDRRIDMRLAERSDVAETGILFY